MPLLNPNEAVQANDMGCMQPSAQLQPLWKLLRA